MTLEKPLDTISEDDLKQLIENQILEKKNLDYKLLLPSNSDADKKEFLADVSSFANTTGGDIIYGMAQDNTTGLPIELKGIDLENPDKETLRLETMIREGIEPRIPSVTTQPIKLANAKMAIIIRIKKSWVSPHRLKFLRSYRFYARGTNGKYELDIGELRNAFTLSESLNERIKRFREERIASLYANETPVPFIKTAKMILHLIPLVFSNPSISYDIEKARANAQFFLPLRFSSGSTVTMRYNLEGLLSFATDAKSGLAFSFTQLYRNGVMEIVDGSTLEPSGNKNEIPSISYEEVLISMLPRYLSGLQNLLVEQPIIIFLTLVGVKGYFMATDIFSTQKSYSIDKDILLLPETIIDTYDAKAEQVLKPAFDAIWNSCGFAKSLNYNEKGEWKPKRPFPYR